ncbi:mitochondrial Complex I (CI) assembly protein NDUFAF3 [Andalucia godoyi]|uniref:Mitochondrial Complex I (CI) assembly protein NDUFAF3 n=1 Tax=Andalucia godoyi TaxID=505711 RepID=A0A8K0AHQ2_ANDGO|nr:mitochondrial Complex I (CI) assembly protein NDUFAF3 [Andalucia godoyi]|eukprot:ANDGO_00657.mRNA.1 mitochondrial Complex I (CI) assembly protein NDUFAF3
MLSRRVLHGMLRSSSRYFDDLNLIANETAKIQIAGLTSTGLLVNDFLILEKRVLCLPRHAHVVNSESTALQIAVPILNLDPRPEILLVGLHNHPSSVSVQTTSAGPCGIGKDVPATIQSQLVPFLDQMKHAGIAVEIQEITAACATFNILNQEDRAVAALLFLAPSTRQ